MTPTDAIETALPAEVMADARIVAECVALGNPVPAEVARRVKERADRIRQQVFAKHGVLDVGVSAIREFRGELPQP